MGFLARHLLRETSTAAERSARVDLVLEGYRGIEHPYLRDMAEALVVRAYAGHDGASGAVQELQARWSES